MSRPIIPPKTRNLVLERDHHLCILNGPHCLRTATTCDHRMGRGMGGNPHLNVPEDLVGACVVCNDEKETVAEVARKLAGRGLKVRRTQSAARDLRVLRDVPVLFADGWHQLTPDGDRVPVLEATALELLAAYGMRSWVEGVPA